MKVPFNKFFTVIAACVLLIGFARSSFAQEAGDAMDEFMNSPADEPPPVIDLPAEKSPEKMPETAVLKPAGKAGKKAAAKMASKPEASADATSADGEVIDMRAGVVPLATDVSQASPALDKVEALMIAEAELKVFMKAGGLKSQKIK